MITKINALKHKKSPIESKINLISNLYRLNKFEYEFLVYYILKNINSYIHNISSFFDINFKGEKFAIIGIQIWELKIWEINQIKKEFEMKEYNDNLVNTDLDIKDLTAKIKSCGKLNFSLCLYGEPGTGKSLYARYLAKELGVEVIMKRASDLISKYVGETEQNIADAFAEAKSKKAMLIFDEADSFLQNRSNAVRSWEISQVNELLTWMEAHEYPFVCTTNLLDTLDEASLRRFTFKIKFDFMKKEQVNTAFEHFFGIKNTDINIKGLTAGDFATVKKKADFLCITDLDELSKMLEDEVKVKKSKELQNSVGF